MAEAEFISDLIFAMQDGIQAGDQKVRDSACKKYDNNFPSRRLHERRFRETIDIISGVFGGDLAQSGFRAIRLFYPLFCAIYHLKFGLPKLRSKRTSFKPADYTKMKTALEYVDELLEKTEELRKKQSDSTLSADEIKFYDAYRVHWVHSDKRIIVTDYICKKLGKALDN